MWVALINLEHKYGSMQSLESLFKRAILESKVSFYSDDKVVIKLLM